MIFVRYWIVWSAVLVSGGWLLSWLQALNRVGYGCLLAGVAALLWLGVGGRGRRPFRWRLRRFRRPAPLLFLATAGLALASGLLVPVTNWDSLVYRMPRVLHWLAAGQWHWIHSFDPRLNIANTGYEWLAAPLVLFMNSDRLFFVPNWISFLLLPGLFFSVVRQLGVQRRVAWWWMWLLPSGWCFALQAASTVNDAFAVIYALAAINLALRACRRGDARDYLLALLAAALLTGAKQTVMPLVLAVAPALWLGRRLVWRLPIMASVAAVVALAISGLPVLLMNVYQTGSWSGVPAAVLNDPIYQRWVNMPAPMPHAGWGVLGNLFAVPLQNLAPPYFPWADPWNAAMGRFVASPFGEHFREFEGLGRLFPRATEHSAGLGLAFCLLLLWCVVAWLRSRGSASAGGADPRQLRASTVTGADGAAALQRSQGVNQHRAVGRVRNQILIGALIAAVVFCGKVGTWANARQLAPYYPLLLLPLLAAAGQGRLVRRRAWVIFALLVMVSPAFWLARAVRGAPLFVGGTPEWHRSLSKSLLPRDGSRLGYATTWGQIEIGLLLPVGETRTYRVGPGETGDGLRALGLRYLVVDSSALAREAVTIEGYAGRMGGRIIATESCAMVPGAAEPVYLLDLRGE